MKTLTAIKSITGILFILIIGGFVLVANKISEKSSDSKPKITPFVHSVSLTDEENIASVTPCGDFTCVLVTGPARSSTLFVIDPASGTVQQRISFNKSEN